MVKNVNLNEKCELIIRVPTEFGTKANRVYFRDGIWHLDEIEENYDCTQKFFTSQVFKTDEEYAKLSSMLSEIFKNNCGFEVRPLNA